jgi:hypothetical protein
MSTALKLGGCPFSEASKHNQNPDFLSTDPLAQINRGNFAYAIKLYEHQAAHGRLSAEDCARLAHAYQNTGNFGKSSEWFQHAVDANPHHPLAAKWQESVEADATAERAGVGIQRPNKVTEEYLETDPVEMWAKSPDNWVLCTDFKPAGSYVPPQTLVDKAKNFGWATFDKALVPLGTVASTYGNLVAKLRGPGNPGIWTLLPIQIGKLGVLLKDRIWMESHERDLDAEYGQPVGGLKPARTDPPFAGTITPDGAYISTHRNEKGELDRPGEGRVGTPFVAHGLPEGTPAIDESKTTRRPSPRAIAERFGYRNGHTIEADQANVSVFAHLQPLVHDVAQTAPDNVKKRPVEVADPELAELGITHRWMRADAPDPRHPDSNNGVHSTSVWWIMSHIFGNDLETRAQMRCFPDGTHVPKGKFYMEGMDKKGNGGEWLPVVEVEVDGVKKKQILTGMGRNLTAPVIAEMTLYLRHYNWACDILSERHQDPATPPEQRWSDNQVADVAMRVVIGTYAKIHTGIWTYTTFANPAIVEGLTANIFGRREKNRPLYSKAPREGRQIYRPEQGTSQISDGVAAGEVDSPKPEIKGKGFTKAYAGMGHAITPDFINQVEIGKKVVKGVTPQVNLKDLRELDGHAYLKDRGLGQTYYDMWSTKLPAPVAGNTADFFRGMHTEEGMMDMIEQRITKDRERGNSSWGEYQDAHHIPRHTKFEHLFKDPAFAAARGDIAWLEENYPDGVASVDSELALLLSEQRPEGVVITNEGFQTFVLEASNRIRKSPILTDQWHPGYIGWTAINMVEAVDKEKLLYLHCPELREYLEKSNVKNTYEYVGTTPEEAPQDHPLHKFVNFGERDLRDMGLGWSWKDEHFKQDVSNYMLRVDHAPTGQSFVVDLTDGEVRADLDRDGRVQGREVLRTDPQGVTLKQILDAAKAISTENDIPWPGATSDNHPGFVSGYKLAQDEVNRLKKYKGDPKDLGVAPRLTDLEVHTLMFNLLGRTMETARAKDNNTGWKIFEKSGLRALWQTMGSIAAFGNVIKGTIALRTSDMAKRRPGKSTGIFGPDGNLNRARLESYRGVVRDIAAKYENGAIPEDAFLAMLKGNNAVNFLSKAQWESLFRLLERMYGKAELTLQNFDDFYSNKLFIEAFNRFAPEELKEELRGTMQAASRDAKRCPAGHG